MSAGLYYNILIDINLARCLKRFSIHSVSLYVIVDYINHYIPPSTLAIPATLLSLLRHPPTPVLPIWSIASTGEANRGWRARIGHARDTNGRSSSTIRIAIRPKSSSNKPYRVLRGTRRPSCNSTGPGLSNDGRRLAGDTL